MPRELDLTDLVTKEHFCKVEKMFRKHFDLHLETVRTDSREIRQMSSADCHPEFCRLVRNSKTGFNRCRQERLRSLNTALETGQPYITICHAGIVLGCIPVMDRDTALGGIFFGKCLWEPYSEPIEDDIFKRLRGLRLEPSDIRNAAASLKVVTGRKIHHASEFLYILLYEVTALDPHVVNWRRQRTEQQASIGEVIQQSKKTGLGDKYPYQSERQLIGKVKTGDRTGAKEILNNILGTIMFQNPGDTNILKARLVELLSILSRAAAEGGVDINRLLEKNLDYFNAVIRIQTQEDLCAWISKALNDFIESVYSSQDAKKITQIRPAIEFIEANFDQPITLADIAKAAHLSISRLSHLFKEQMSVTIIDYLTNVRTNQAQRLLLTTDKTCTKICFETGYNNQSYFTRTFKELTGLTPRQFREQNRRVQNKSSKLRPDNNPATEK